LGGANQIGGLEESFRLNLNGLRAEGSFVKRGKTNRKKPARAKTGALDKIDFKIDDKAAARQQAPACLRVRAAGPNVELVVKHFERRRRLSEQKRLYLRVGDEVSHLRYEEWGMGVVMEVMTSSVPGGTCLARIHFEDGQVRCFNNDLDNEGCCYFFGVRRCWNPVRAKNGVRAAFFQMKG
jgi:hypothetical protein